MQGWLRVIVWRHVSERFDECSVVEAGAVAEGTSRNTSCRGPTAGCQWRLLPADFPPWLSVHQQFRAWRDSGVWERVTKTLREQGRQSRGRNGTPSVAIIDSQSVKTVLKGGGAVMTRAKRSRGASDTLR